MIHSYINERSFHSQQPWKNKSSSIDCLLKSRNLFTVQTFQYDLIAVCSTDLDPTGNFILVGLSNGAVDLQGIQEHNNGWLDHVTRLNVSPSNLHRVQWNPGDEQFFSTLDNHNLFLVDPVELRVIDKFSFNLKTTWSEWNPNDRKMIAVCGTESQIRLVDIRSGSSVQTIILGAKSGLASHRATRCLWSGHDINCLIVGDNEGYLHVYDTRHSTRPQLLAGEERGQISGLAFTRDQNSLITSQGTENQLVQWYYDKCSLRSNPNKFKKKKPSPAMVQCNFAANATMLPTTSNGQQQHQQPGNEKATTSREGSIRGLKRAGSEKKLRKNTKRIIPLPVDAYIRCQFYVTDKHIFCPVPARVTKSKELYIYDLDNGHRIKTLKSNEVLCQGVYSVTGLLPDSLVLYVGGRNRLRTWTVDEDYQRKMDEKKKTYHKSSWESDNEEH